MTDLYPDEDGFISEGEVIGLCYASGSITVGDPVKIVVGDRTVTQIQVNSCNVSVLAKDNVAQVDPCIGIALTTASGAVADGYDPVAVVTHGVYKVKASGDIEYGSRLRPGTTGYVVAITRLSATGIEGWGAVVSGNAVLGQSIGRALQAASNGDEFLALIAI